MYMKRNNLTKNLVKNKRKNEYIEIITDIKMFGLESFAFTCLLPSD